MVADLKKLTVPTALVAEPDIQTAGTIAFTEGPAVDAEGNLFFSDIANNRIMRRAVDGTISVWRADSGRANGNMFDAVGRLVTCEGGEFGAGGRRRITRTDMRTGVVEVLTDRYEGKRYNSPNDLTIDPGVYIVTPEGEMLGRIPVSEDSVTNLAFGGPDLRTLYIVAGKSVFSIRVKVSGHLVYPGPNA